MKTTLMNPGPGDLPKLAFWCPGCDTHHAVPVTTQPRVGAGGGWFWNGDHQQPTLTPSLATTYNGRDAGQEGRPPAVCHLYLTDGVINYLSDTTHKLAGQQVPLEDLP